MRNLYFFTQYFPFCEGAETFIENEIWIAAKHFDHVYIIPDMQKDGCRPIPPNTSIISPEIKSGKDIVRLGLKNMTPGLFVKLIKEILRRRFCKSLRQLRFAIIQALKFSALLSSVQLTKVRHQIKPGDILYSYWGTGWGTVIPFDKKLPNKFLCRFHGGDLYAERGSALLFREHLLGRLDLAVFISRHGEEYQKRQFSQIPFRSSVSYLGTIDHGISSRSKDGMIRIVSCSHIVPVKRVNRIFDALVKYGDGAIEWTHIGGRGDALDNLRHYVACTPHNFKVNLPGEIPNTDVMRFFVNTPVDMFINVSSSEGLPVSIMEAASFDIPIIATDVGGTSEIVNQSTGVLLSADPNSEEIISAIEQIRKSDIHPREFWKENFEAKSNYDKFYEMIKSL